MASVTARITFKLGEASYFCNGANQSIVEMRFESVADLIETLRGIQSSILNCTAIINGKVIDLRQVSGLDKPADDNPVAC